MTALTTIKGLPPAASPAGTDALELEQSSSHSITLADLADWVIQNGRVTPNGGTRVDLNAVLVSLDPSAPGFSAAMSALFKAWFASLPVYSGDGPAPVAVGEPFNNNGVIQIAQ